MTWIIMAIILASLLESVAYLYPFTLMVIVVLALTVDQKVYRWAFLGGLFLDLIAFRPLGSDSIFFLVTCFFLSRYKMKIYFGNILYVFIFLLVIISVYDYFFNRILFSAGHFVLTLVLGAFLLSIVPRIFPEKIGSKQKLII